jgi:hypothetical protein
MQEERFGNRDRTYSAWHRRSSVRRFVGIEKAQLLAMIDLDGALYCISEQGPWSRKDRGGSRRRPPSRDPFAHTITRHNERPYPRGWDRRPSGNG